MLNTVGTGFCTARRIPMIPAPRSTASLLDHPATALSNQEGKEIAGEKPQEKRATRPREQPPTPALAYEGRTGASPLLPRAALSYGPCRRSPPGCKLRS